MMINGQTNFCENGSIIKMIIKDKRVNEEKMDPIDAASFGPQMAEIILDEGLHIKVKVATPNQQSCS